MFAPNSAPVTVFMSPRACASVVPVSSSAVYKDPFVTHTPFLAANSLQIWATCTLKYWCVLAENGILVRCSVCTTSCIIFQPNTCQGRQETSPSSTTVWHSLMWKARNFEAHLPPHAHLARSPSILPTLWSPIPGLCKCHRLSKSSLHTRN